MKISKNIKKPIVTYGTSPLADFRAINIKYKTGKSFYNLVYNEKDFGQIIINAPGNHNVLNSLSAIALGIELNIPFDKLKSGINNYIGVRRRFDIKENNSEIMVVDDYAHHPTEVNATITAAKTGWKKKIVSVFQPHLFTRTRDFYKEFAESLFQSDYIIITDIYPAREEPIEEISSQLIVKELKRLGHQNIIYIDNLTELNGTLDNLGLDNHMVITMGAGDIWRFNDNYNDHLIKKNRATR